MSHLMMIMVIDQEKFDFFNTDSSCVNNKWNSLNWLGPLHSGSGENSMLEKGQVARIITNKASVYSGGEDDPTV